MFRKFLKILVNVTDGYNESVNLKDFLYEKKGHFIDQLNKKYFDLSNNDTDISKSVSPYHKQLTITFALTFCEKMLVQIINSAESYIQAFVEIAKGSNNNAIDDNKSLSQRELFFNRISPADFKKMVSNDGVNPIGKIYGF
jgi:hypothetical protein